MEVLSSYNLIIGASVIVILSFWFNGISKKTNIPSVLMLIVLGSVYSLDLNILWAGKSILKKTYGGPWKLSVR
ncbi:MAG TPA: hypothetical protein VFD35_11325 [Pricia sp.]|nr:hypothetical protein [Pricia sp.]